MPDRLLTRRLLAATAGTALLPGRLTTQAGTDICGPEAPAAAPEHRPRGAVYSRFLTRSRAG